MTTLTDLTLMRQRDVERLLAASIMIDPVLAVQSCGWLDPDVILDERVKAYWKQIKSSVRPDVENAAAVEMSVSALLELGMLDAMNWQAELPSSTMPVVFANELSRRAYLSEMTIGIGKLMQAVQKADDAQVKEIVSELAGKSATKTTIIPTALDVAGKFAGTVESGTRSIKTFITKLDRATGGLERQTLTILAARPSVGKTALAWQIAQQVAYAQYKVIFFSLEMSSVNLWGRAACPKIETTWRDVRAGRLNPEQQERLIEQSYAHAMQFEDRLKIEDGNQTTATIWQIVAEHRPDLVIVDHLRLVKDDAPSEIKRLGLITQRLKDIAKSFGCAVLLCSQLNRNLEGRDNKTPVLADLRDSGEIEENADLVMMIHRPDVASGASAQSSPTEIWVRKFRDGPRDILIKLLFNAKDEWFEEP